MPSDDFLLEVMMVLVDKLGGDVTVTEDDLARVIDGQNEIRMGLPEGKASTSVRLRVVRGEEE